MLLLTTIKPVTTVLSFPVVKFSQPVVIPSVMISDTHMMFPFLSMKDQIQQLPFLYTNSSRYMARYLLFIIISDGTGDVTSSL